MPALWPMVKDAEANMSNELRETTSQSGQTIVLVALLFAILLLFVGLAVDVGLAFVRSSEFSRAVDSATLAGVVDLDISLPDCTSDPMALSCPAHVRAQQFLASNGWPISQTTQFDGIASYTEFGIPQYTLTVTYPINTYLIRLLGINDFPVTHSASAVYYAHTDVFVPTSLDDGHIRKASQFVTGPNGCASTGDPIMPLSTMSGGSKIPNPNYEAFDSVYRYRVRVPSDYVADTIRVELFDPDSVNADESDGITITHSDVYVATGGNASSSESCTALGAPGRGQPCIFETGEGQSGAAFNPVWLVRVDEYFNSQCTPTDDANEGDTQLIYDLYTLDQNGTRQDLVRYTWNLTDTVSATDMKWVTPGVTTDVDVDPLPGYALNSFDIPFNLLPDAGLAPRYIYMDVFSLNGGSARNVWDVRAGPPPEFYEARGLTALVEDVNDRNLQLANFPGQYDVLGLTVSAIGRMPMDNHIVDEPVRFTLAPVGELRERGSAYMTLFDYEDQQNGITPPPDIAFDIDTDWAGSGLESSFIAKVNQLPAAGVQIAYCDGGSDCNNTWTEPNYVMSLPDPSEPGQAFGGGNIIAEYEPNGDAHTWWLSITAGRPFLTR